MEIIRHFEPETYKSALEDWQWLDPIPTLEPRFANAFGDMFLEGPDGAYWFLDTIRGTVERTWADAEALQNDMNTLEAQNRYLMPGLVQVAENAGLIAGPSTVISFSTPPILGGEFAVENLEISDFEVTVSFAGQIHEQVM